MRTIALYLLRGFLQSSHNRTAVRVLMAEICHSQRKSSPEPKAAPQANYDGIVEDSSIQAGAVQVEQDNEAVRQWKESYE